MDFEVQELADVLGKAVFPEGYRLHDFNEGITPPLPEAVAGSAFNMSRYVGIQRESDGNVFFLGLK